MSLRVIVSGSRTWTDTETVQDALDAVGRACSFDMTVVHGGAKGADRLAQQWIAQHLNDGVTEERHYPEWRVYGKKAGPIRNRHMIALGADLVLAFIDPCASEKCTEPQPHGSHGVSHMVDLAHAFDVPVRAF